MASCTIAMGQPMLNGAAEPSAASQPASRSTLLLRYDKTPTPATAATRHRPASIAGANAQSQYQGLTTGASSSNSNSA